MANLANSLPLSKKLAAVTNLRQEEGQQEIERTDLLWRKMRAKGTNHSSNKE